MFEEYKVKIVDSPTSFATYVYIWRESGKERFILGADGETETKVNIGDGDIKPTLITSSEMLQKIANEIVEGGFKPEKVSRIEGKLEATEKHLEDMRKLVFKTK